jgi:hypothetical protein
VGSDAGVFVGKGVCVGVSVGGNGVAVGIAACVWATIVNAAATAVDWTSATLIVGVASGPHAASRSAARRIEIVLVVCFISWFTPCVYTSTIGVASTLGDNGFISNDNRPAASIEQKASGHLEISLAVDQGKGTVISCRS